MRIGVDAMGGDYAPETVVLGAIEATKFISPSTIIVLYGDRRLIEPILEANGGTQPSIEVVHTSETISMNDHPTQAFSQKSDSSITVGFSHLKAGKIDGFASAGSTGAMMVGCMFVSKQIEGVIRPTIATTLPTVSGGRALLLDVGLNVDCKPEVLYQYGIIGSIYCKEMLSIETPRVGLLNIGEEPEKGNTQTKAAFALMSGTKDFNFIGNVEPRYMFNAAVADVFICDGFTGNLIIKMAEGFYSMFEDSVSDNHNIMKGLNYENEGGTPVLGVNECVIIGHGCSSAKAIKNMILNTEKNISMNLTQKIKAAFC